jgi:arylsulfatase A-like enzyme
MIRRIPLLILTFFLYPIASSLGSETPNIIIIFCDDLGYGDLGSYGSKVNRTPRIDGLTKEGMRFTDFYSSSPVCTPSRASLLTGSYARRVGMHEDASGHWVLIPRSKRGLNPTELTLAEALKTKAYATACIGKWHLGDQAEHLPTRHGFDYYFGIPYSNDMQQAKRGDPPLPLVSEESVIEAPADQSTLTKRYTEEAIRFIEENQNQPFFLYLPHTFPHLPLFASPAFKDKSANGRYGDAIEEIDWSTGEILDCLDRLKLVDNTLVIFTSDNGSNARNGGSNLPLAGKKGETMEGGMRVPMIARWPGNIPAGTTCTEISTTMDFLPTICSIVGAQLPKGPIDGHDIQPLFYEAKSAESPYEAFYYYRRRQLQAIRQGDWKYHLSLIESHPNWTTAKTLGPGRPEKLVNLARDLQETTDLSTEYPDILLNMHALADTAIEQLGNDAKKGTAQRKSYTLETSAPMLLEQSDLTR